jgi:hypothetical protein
MLRNRSDRAVRLSTAVGIERKTPAGWKAIEAEPLLLRFCCDTAPQKCLTLVPGAEYLPPAWQMSHINVQCAVHPGPQVEPGKYRLFVDGCQKAFRIYSQPFVIEASR